MGCLGILMIGVVIFGIGRCANCDFAKSDAEKLIGKEIAWGTKGSLPAGQRYEFTCPKDGTAGDVVGSDLYLASESSICTAAAHAGVIELKEGGKVTIDVQVRKGLVLRGSERHGVRSLDASNAKERTEQLKKAPEEADWSDTVFSVVGAPPPPEPVLLAPPTKFAPQPSHSTRSSKPAKPAQSAAAKPSAPVDGESASE